MWARDSASAFLIRLPPTFRRRPLKGLDSEVGRWASDTARLTYDYGAYSNPLEEAPYLGGISCAVTIGGKPTRVVALRDSTGEFVVAAHWKVFGEHGMGPVSLTIHGATRDSLQVASLIASIWSITFKQ